MVTGIVLEGIDFSRDGIRVLMDLHLTVTPGEYLTVAGPSGSGKTTLLRLIAGLEPIQQGKKVLSDCQRAISKSVPIAFVFQGGALYPHLSVQENLEFSHRIRGTPTSVRKSKVDRIGSMLGLLDLMRRLPEEISGGEAQRVAIGRALMQEPAVLLLDEPFANLDGPLRASMRGLLRHLHREMGITTIHVTHDQEEAMALGDRVALLHAGQIQQVGPPETVYRRPVNRWAARFLGTPPINLAAGEFRSSAHEHVFVLEPDSGRGEVIPASVALGLPTNTRLEVGLRPEHIRAEIPDKTDETLAHTRATLRRVEFTGANSWWQVDWMANNWVIRGIEDARAEIGSQWPIRIDWTAAVWFDPTTGKALSRTH